MAMYAYPSACAASAIGPIGVWPSLASVCICRSPRICSRVTSTGSRCVRASSISPRASRSSGGIQSRPRAPYTSSSVRPATRRVPSKTPYSFSLNFFAWAILRSSMLCACEPVKYCSADPYASGSTARRSTCRPPERRTVARVGPCETTRFTSGYLMKRAIAWSGAVLVTRMSRSPIVSRRRRKLPATSIC